MARENAFRGEMAWASNMYESNIVFDGTNHNLVEIFPQFKFDGLEYASSEHLYQSLKATNDADKELIRTAPNAHHAKQLSRTIFARMDWDNVKVEAMRLALGLKFYQHPDLLLKLINTGNTLLVETNWWGDKFWGVCGGVGQNWLGRLLMELRMHNRFLARNFGD